MKLKTNESRGLWTTGLVLMAFLMTVKSGWSDTYPDAPIAQPSPSPIFPEEFKMFSPPVSNNTLNSLAPGIGEWTRINGPGDTLVLTGSRLSSFTGDAEGRDTRFVLFGQSGLSEVETDGFIRRLDGMQASVTLPDTLPENEMYLMWPKNNTGYGAPVSINQTELWWVGPDAISKGGFFSIYGRNLKLGNGKSYLYIEELSRWLVSNSSNPYKADFTLPSNVQSGTYTIWAHNGSGLQYGWSKPLQVTVENPVIWNGPTINVKDYGAKGDGSSDDLPAIRAALDAAKNMDFPTVYFPEGTYLLSGSLHNAKYDMRLMGAGRDLTTISTHPNYGNDSNVAYGLFYSRSQSGPVEFRDMTLSTGAYLGASLIGPTLVRARDGLHGTFENVLFTQIDHPNQTSHTPIVDFGGSSYMTFRNCEFVLAGSVNINAGSRQSVFESCVFRGINDVDFMINIAAARECSIINCLAQNYDSSNPNDGHGWAQGRFVYGSGSYGLIADIYYGENTTSDLTVREAFTQNQNTGEQFMTEFGRTLFRGNPIAATSSTVQFSGLSEDFTGKIVVVVGGKGLGQNRQISGVDTSTGRVTIEGHWNVVPDTSSIVMIGNYSARHVVYNNHFDGVERAVVTDVPSTAGVMPYGSQLDMVVDSNYFHQLKHGISLWAIQNTIGADIVCRPLYFNLFANNTLVRCRRAIDNSVPIYSGSPTVWDISMLGNVFRNNTISNTTEYAFRNRTWEDDHSIAMCVYDQNTSVDCVTNIGDDMGLRNQIWVGNQFTSFGGGVGISISGDHIPSLYQNTWDGFSSTYEGALPGAVLELPNRVVGLDRESLSAEIPVRNSGTDILNWSAATDASWLNITKSSGSVADESSEDTILFEIDASAIPEGETEAVITVSAAGKEQQMTVEFSSEPPPPNPPPAPVLTDIVISGTSSMDEGTAAQYLCTASYSDGTTATVAATWSENSTYASISASGVLTAGTVSADQNATLTASFGGLTDTHAVTINYVPSVLTGIVISGSVSLDEESSAQYSCTANYSDGSSVAITPSWSENSSFATISGSGLLSSGNVSADQSVTLTASYGGETDTYSVTINYVPPTLLSIAISGSASLDEGTTAQYICTATYSDGSSVAVTPNWSENSSYASISGSGILSANNVSANQSVVITASFGGKSDTHGVTIRYVAPTLSNILISGPAAMDEETSAQYVCTANYSDGSSQIVVPAWSENSSYTTVSSSGWLAAADVSSDQNVTITATYGGKSDTHAVAVNYIAPLVELTSITISGTDTMEEITTSQYVCTAHYSDGTSAEVSPSWSANSTFVSIDASGLLSAANVAGDENVTVTASFDGQVDTQALVIMVIGDQVVFPLNGFDGKTVSAELWDDAAQTTIPLGEEFEPEEIVIENVNSNQWYWLGLREYNVADDEWELVHGRWIWM